jgi:hypothetical protein
MRYLATSELRVTGPQKLTQKLAKPNELFQDVKLIAYPAPKDEQQALNAKNAKITSIPAVPGIAAVADGNQDTGITFPDKK